MSGLRETLAHYQSLRRTFENQLVASRPGSSSPDANTAQAGTRLCPVPAFGTNPGDLRMLVHAPAALHSAPALVVALHGCGQSAAEFAAGTGWSTLADRYGFVVVYPEQASANNPNSCFSWFQPGDISRHGGEARSIQEMVEHVIQAHGVDRRKIFVTGLSAGGAMACAMLATYPEVYAGGAIVAGLPYGSASSVQEAFEAMFSEQFPSDQELGDRVRAASAHTGPWPRVSIWHGADDTTVRPSNASHLVRQWTKLHGLAIAYAHVEEVAGHTRRVWNDADGNALVESYTIRGMGHGVPLAREGSGSTGPYFLAAGISSTDRIAHFWGLDDGQVAHRPVQLEAVVTPAEGQSTEQAVTVPARADSAPRRPPVSPGLPEAGYVGDVDSVIAAAFKAAGLPVPALKAIPRGVPAHVDAGAIIEAALKAAGLKR